MQTKRRKARIVDMMVAGPMSEATIRKKAVSAEPTGKGDLLVVNGWTGRMFRSEEGCVRDELEEFNRKYQEDCRRLDEDPAHEYYEVTNWGDLYCLHGIIPMEGSSHEGWTNDEDHRVASIDFDCYMVTEGEWVERLGEPYLYYCPRDYCLPDPCYMEV